MATTIEAIEVLTETVSRQARLIVKLCSVLEQHGAITSLDEEIARVQALTATALSIGGGDT